MIENITVVMGYASRVDLTQRAIDQLLQVSNKINLIIINNGCNEPGNGLNPPLTINPDLAKKKVKRLVFLHNENNAGCLPMLRQALPYIEDDDIMVYMHNDVLIWMEGWDDFVRKAFDENSRLGLAGLFGAPGVTADGGRLFSKSTMIGKEWGTDWAPHGSFLEEGVISPSAVLDSLCMMFRGSAIKEVGIPDEWPPHHWFDRLFCTRFIENHWKVATLGIPFDHYGGGSSGPVMDTFAQKWVKDKTGTDMNEVDANMYLYNEGAQIWLYDYAHRMTLITDGWDYIWRQHRQ